MTGAGVRLLALGLAGLALVVVAAATARPPVAVVSDRDGYFVRWSALHGGYDVRTGSAFVRGWLTAVHAVARPLARRGVQPDVVTVGGLWLAFAVLVLADAGGRWPLAAGVLLVVSALLDSLDGSVAVLSGRTTRWGYVLDSVVDRASDAVYLLAVVAVGCPPELAVGLGFAFFTMEYLRARAGSAGGDGVGRITMAERPTRVIVLALTLGLAGAVPALAEVAALAGPLVLLAMTLVATVQLAVTVRRQLLALPAGTGVPDRGAAGQG